MPLAMEINTTGLIPVIGRLRAMRDRLIDARPIMTKIYDVVLITQQEWWSSDGNGTWAALSPAWAAEKERIGADPRILRMGMDRYGKVSMGLEASVTDPGHAHHVRIITNHSMTIGTDVPYAKPHQEGTANMPARPVMHFPLEDRKLIGVMVKNWITLGH